jgi:hypothetical protein
MRFSDGNSRWNKCLIHQRNGVTHKAQTAYFYTLWLIACQVTRKMRKSHHTMIKTNLAAIGEIESSALRTPTKIIRTKIERRRWMIGESVWITAFILAAKQYATTVVLGCALKAQRAPARIALSVGKLV